jgi:quinohemoprotein ethanol dehydrogenase
MVVAVTAFFAWVLLAQQVKRVDDAALRNAAKTGEEWLTYGHDYAETHYSPLKQIDASNVKRLGLAWTWATESPSGANVEGTPLVSNGVMYGSLGWGVLFAIDARTGKYKWRWDPEIDRTHISDICCGGVNRGVALYQGRVYAGLVDGTLVALDQETGKQVWRTKVKENDDTLLTSAVRIVKGKVIVGSSGAEQAIRGFFAAYDAATGKQVWRFYTVPGDPKKPFENPEMEMAAKTWTGDWWKAGGGGTVWDGMAYDPDADILYVGTGNGGPWPAIIRSPQGGDNLFLSSIIAVKPDSGKMVWYFQETPGETWDYTSVQSIVLADMRIGGRDRKVLLHAPKNGFFYVLDRITGEFLSGEKFVKRMTWATGLDKKGRPIEAKGARFDLSTGVLVSPGTAGGHNWQPMAFSLATGLVYIPGQETERDYVPEQEYRYLPGWRNTGVAIGKRPPEKPFVGPVEPAGGWPRPEGAANQPPVPTPPGFLLAWDPATQKERWRITGTGVGGFLAGGAMATAGNLVFHGGAAYHAETGEKLWSVDLGGGIVTPISYMLDGKQYVSWLAGPQTNSRVYTFVLDGRAAMPSPVPAPPKP